VNRAPGLVWSVGRSVRFFADVLVFALERLAFVVLFWGQNNGRRNGPNFERSRKCSLCSLMHVVGYGKLQHVSLDVGLAASNEAWARRTANEALYRRIIRLSHFPGKFNFPGKRESKYHFLGVSGIPANRFYFINSEKRHKTRKSPILSKCPQIHLKYEYSSCRQHFSHHHAKLNRIHTLFKLLGKKRQISGNAKRPGFPGKREREIPGS
jgi:hypothetical protein